MRRVRLAVVAVIGLVMSGGLSCAGSPERVPAAGQQASDHPPGSRAAQPPSFQPLPASPRGEPGKAMAALGDELARAMRELAKQDPPPYFISYALYDRTGTFISASDGSVVHSFGNQRRTLDVDVRVGDHRFDSTRELPGLRPTGTVSLRAPTEDDPAALATEAWSATNVAYRQAAGRFADLRTRARVDVERADKSADFSKEQPTVHVEPPARLEIDRPAWEQRLRALSARFKAAPEVLDASVSMSTDALTRSVLTSEGTRVQSAGTWVNISFNAYTRAPDGDFLSRNAEFYRRSLSELPTQAELEKEVDRLVAELQALRKAPRGEPFAGPALLDGRAAGVFLHETFGHRLEGSRLKEESDGQTFVKKLGQPVMPSFLSVYDDPTVLKLGEVPLNGAYRHDDEGVPARRATLIDGGVLRGFLMGRTPVAQFAQSNGHGRRQEGRTPEARQANLIAHPTRAVSPEELRGLLRAEATRQGKPYGLLVKDISGGMTTPGAGSGQGFSLRPTLAYRVYVDGRPDELIRGVSMVGTPLTALSKLVAAGDDYAVFNGRCGSESGWVPVSAASPSLLIGQLETERLPKGQERPPLLPRPPVAAEVGGEGPDDATIRKVMEEEMARSMKELRVPGEPAPHHIVYTLSDVEDADTSATLGAARGSSHDRYRFLRVEVRVGDPKSDSGNFVNPQLGTSPMAVSVPVPLTDDAFGLRKKLWLRTDDTYKTAIKLYAQKRAAAKTASRSAHEAAFDFAEAKPSSSEFKMKGSEEPVNLEKLAELTRTLSAAGRDSAEVHECTVTAKHYKVRRRVLTSDGGWKDERTGFVDLEARAASQAEDGMHVRQRVGFESTGPSGLPPLPEMQAKVRKMIEDLHATRAGTVPARSSAVVLFEGDSAVQMYWMLLANHLSGTPPPAVAAGRAFDFPVEDFADNIGQRIAPAFLDVWDDPRVESGPGGQSLGGAYKADDEAVPAERVSLVEKGILKSLFMSRTPRKEILRSNGHGRGRAMAGAVRGHWGVLTVSAGKAGMTDAQLRARAIKEAASDGPGTPVYIVRSVQNASVGAEGARGGVQPFSVSRLQGGKEQAVRGLSMTSVAPRSLKDIVAAGRTLHAHQLFDGGGPDSYRTATILGPSFVMKNVEVRGDTRQQPKPPLYPRPPLAAAPAAATR